MLGAVGPLIVLSGPTGVGKSTVGRLVAAEFARSVHLRADDLMASVVGGFVDGHLFPASVAGLAAACSERGLSCHDAVLAADVDTCWTRAVGRGGGRWPLQREPVAKLHARFAALALDPRHVVDATGSPVAVSEAVLAAFRARELALTA